MQAQQFLLNEEKLPYTQPVFSQMPQKEENLHIHIHAQIPIWFDF